MIESARIELKAEGSKLKGLRSEGGKVELKWVFGIRKIEKIKVERMRR